MADDEKEEMALESFSRFSELPAEIRDSIWNAAICPRLVHIEARRKGPDPIPNPNPTLESVAQNASRTRFQWITRDHLSHLYSKSPIPPLLHLCRESRQAMIRRGYELAFGIQNGAHIVRPQVWFNFNFDALYFPLQTAYYFNYFVPPGSSGPGKHYITHAAYRDRDRVKTLALLDERGTSPDVIHEDSAPTIDLFENLENVLLVEHHCGWDYESDRTGIILGSQRDQPGDLWGYMECEVSDITQGAEGFCRHQQMAGDYGRQIWDYKRREGRHGRNFFKDRARNIEEKLKEMKRGWGYGPIVDVSDNVVKKIYPMKRYRAPEIRCVYVMPRSKAQKFVEFRNSYWEGIQEREDWEAVFGHPHLHEERDPYWQALVDDDAVMLDQEVEDFYYCYFGY